MDLTAPPYGAVFYFLPKKLNMLSEKLVLELGQILKEEYGVELTGQQLYEFATNLVKLFSLLSEIEYAGR